MDWVKRNLVFVIGSVVALALLAFSGLYLVSNWKKNTAAQKDLEQEYNELRRLSNLNPHPGKGRVDNIKLAREQREEVLGVMKEVADHFTPIHAIPESEKVTGEGFSAALRRTMDQMQRQAANASVVLPPEYSFSFEAEKPLVRFAPNSLDQLAIQLGEVKAICQILFNAKVNSLENLRRERVSLDDDKGPQTDYLSETSKTNDLGVISPYEITFRSFSTELARVVAGFANSPHGMVIRAINVAPASDASGPDADTPVYGRPNYAPEGEYTPAANYRAVTPAARYGEGAEGRYGARRTRGNYGARGRMPGEFDRGAGARRTPNYRTPNYRVAPTTPAYTYVQPGTTPGVAPTGTQTLVDEHPLSVTLIVDVIKLAPLKTEE